MSEEHLIKIDPTKTWIRLSLGNIFDFPFVV